MNAANETPRELTVEELTQAVSKLRHVLAYAFNEIRRCEGKDSELVRIDKALDETAALDPDEAR